MESSSTRLRAATPSRPRGSRRRRAIVQGLSLSLLVPMLAVVAIATTAAPAGATIMHPYDGIAFQTWGNMQRLTTNEARTQAPSDVAGCPGKNSPWQAFTTQSSDDHDWARVCYTELPGEVHVNYVEFAQLQYGCSNGYGAVGIEPHTLSLWQGSEDTEAPFPRYASTRRLLEPYTGLIIDLSQRGYACYNTQFADFNTWSAHVDSPAGGWDLTNGDMVTFPAIFDADVDQNGVGNGAANVYWGSQRYYATGYQPKTTNACVWVHEADFLMSNPVSPPGGAWNHQTTPEPHWMNLCVSSTIPPTATPTTPTPAPSPTSTPTPPGQTAPAPAPTPPPDNPPSGNLASASFTKNGYQVRVTGTASDPDASSVKVDFYAPGSGQWVGGAYTSGGSFDSYVTLPASPVDYRVCAAVENVGSQWYALNRWIGCIDPDKRPTGIMGNAVYTGTGLNVRFTGYASDADTSNLLRVDLVTDDGQVLGSTTNGAASLSSVYGSLGFDTTVQMPMQYLGLRVCAWVRDFGGYQDAQIGCLVPRSVPIGNLDNVVPAGLNTFAVKGWAFQPGGPFSTQVKVKVGTVETTGVATSTRDDVDAAYPGIGSNHGFDLLVSIPPGLQTVCVTGVNQLGAGGADRQLGCQTVDNRVPVGNLETVKRVGPTTYAISGWAVDPEVNGPVGVDVWLDPGTSVAQRMPGPTAGAPTGIADVYRADLAAAWNTSMNSHYGGSHGFSFNVANVPVGQHNLCVYGLGKNIYGVAVPGENRLIRCETIGTPAQSSPWGRLDNVGGLHWDGTRGVYTVTGWTLDPDVTDPLDVDLYWDPPGSAGAATFASSGQHFAGAASISRADLTADYSGWGISHGFQIDLPVPALPGTHSLCAFGINKLVGGNSNLGCITVVSPGHSPFGRLDATSANPKWNGTAPVYDVTGWSTDPDGTAMTDVDVYWDPQDAALSAGYHFHPTAIARNDVLAAFPGYGSMHGFTVSVPPPSKPGHHQLCAYGVNLSAGVTNTAGGNTTLGCTWIDSSGHDPVGGFDVVEPGFNVTPGIHVRGWELDPDAAAAGTVHVYVDGVNKGALTANTARADIGALFVNYGANHGYDAVIGGIGSGTHDVCVYGINTATGTTNTTLGCRSVTLSDNPSGALDTVELGFNGSRGIHVRGWMIDPNTVSAGDVHIYVDGIGVAVLSGVNVTRNDIGALWVGYGANHGFDTIIGGLSAGTHTVCAYGINIGAGSTNTTLGCKSITLSDEPFAGLDSVTTATGSVRVVGWGIDPNTNASTQVHVYVDGVGTAVLTANLSRADVAAAYPGYGALHGYDATITGLSPGTHVIDLYVINIAGAGSNNLISRRTITV